MLLCARRQASLLFSNFYIYAQKLKELSTQTLLNVLSKDPDFYCRTDFFGKV